MPPNLRAHEKYWEQESIPDRASLSGADTEVLYHLKESSPLHEDTSSHENAYELDHFYAYFR
jgi:hypothetical protein